MRKIISSLLVLAMLVGACFALASCNLGEKPAAEGTSFVTVDINPTLELTVEDGKVTAAYGANEDAQVLLYGEDGIVGADLNAAVEKITALAVELGYITDDNKAVGISVSDEDGANEALKNDIAKLIGDKASALGIDISVCEGDSFSVTRKLEELKEKYPDNEALKNVDISKFRLALSAAEGGEITVVEAVEKTNKELLGIVSEHHKKAEEYATDAYNKASDLANAAYEQAYGLAMDAVYYQYLAENMLSNPGALLYSAAYRMYMTGSRGISYFADCLDYVELITNNPIPEAQITLAAQAFGVSADELKDSDGNVTVKSIEAYADKYFRNTEAGADIEALKAELEEILSTTETTLREEAKAVSEQYKPSIEALITSSRTVLETINTTLGIMVPAEVKSFIEDAFDDYEEIQGKLETAINDGDITTEELREISKELESKASEIEATIETTLSDEDLEEIEKRQAKVAEGLASEKAKLDNALLTAKNSATQKLSELKAAREAKAS